MKRIKKKLNNFSHYQRMNFNLEMMMIFNNLVFQLEIMDAALMKNKKSR